MGNWFIMRNSWTCWTLFWRRNWCLLDWSDHPCLNIVHGTFTFTIDCSWHLLYAIYCAVLCYARWLAQLICYFLLLILSVALTGIVLVWGIPGLVCYSPPISFLRKSFDFGLVSCQLRPNLIPSLNTFRPARIFNAAVLAENCCPSMRNRVACGWLDPFRTSGGMYKYAKIAYWNGRI